MEVAFEDWMLAAAAALVLGVVIGWLLRGGRRGEDAKGAPVEAPAASPGALSDAGSPESLRTDMSGTPVGAKPATAAAPLDSDKLGGIERELQEARALLEENEEDLRLFGEELNELDGAIKRAGGRLRLLYREIRQRALGDPNDDV